MAILNRTSSPLVLVFFSIAITTLVYFYLQYFAIEKYAQDALHNIESQIQIEIANLSQIPPMKTCDEQQRTELAHGVYDDINVRALGIQPLGSDVLCTNHKKETLRLDSDYWDLAAINDKVFLAINKGYQFGQRSSLIIGIEQEEQLAVAAINPILISRLWIDNEFAFGGYGLYLTNSPEAILQSSNEPADVNSFQKGLTFTFDSTAVPLTIELYVTHAYLRGLLLRVLIMGALVGFAISGFFTQCSKIIAHRQYRSTDLY